MSKIYQFSLDHFGVVASPLINQLISQVDNRRKRKSAFSALVKMAKATKQIAANEFAERIGLTVDGAGQIWLTFSVVTIPVDTALAATPKPAKQQMQEPSQNTSPQWVPWGKVPTGPAEHQEDGVE